MNMPPLLLGPVKASAISMFCPCFPAYSVEISSYSLSPSFTTRRSPRRDSLSGFSVGSYVVGGGFTDENTVLENAVSSSKEGIQEGPQISNYESLISGGEQVTSVLQEIIKLLEDVNMDARTEEVALELAAQGVIGQRVDQMESGFMMALDYMIQTAENDNDEQRQSILEVIKQTVLDHLAQKSPPHVQVIGLLCRTPIKESRYQLLRRVAAGGGVLKSKNGTTMQLPGANLNDIANQADDLLETMETRPTIPDRKLLARLVLIREEARDMMGGGILDERNDRGPNTLPEAEVNFLTKIVALKPGKVVRDMIFQAMQGKNEGADEPHRRDGQTSEEFSDKGSMLGGRPLPVRPGMFLETVSKVLRGMYAGNVYSITAQHLEWVHQETVKILQELAF